MKDETGMELYGTVYPGRKGYRKQYSWIWEQVARGDLPASWRWREILSHKMGPKSGVMEGVLGQEKGMSKHLRTQRAKRSSNASHLRCLQHRARV